jgi:putative ABC transport system permease protein
MPTPADYNRPLARNSSTAVLNGIHVRRTDRVPSYLTGGLEVRAADLSLIPTLQGHLLAGRGLSPATERYRVAVLGYEAASALGIASLDQPTRVWLGGSGSRSSASSTVFRWPRRSIAMR